MYSKNWTEFKKFLESKFVDKARLGHKVKAFCPWRENRCPMAFILVYPDNLKWDWWVEKQTYITFRCLLDLRYNFIKSSLYLCKRSEVMDLVKELAAEMWHDRVFIAESGMVFTDQYYDLMTFNTYMTGHIMADQVKEGNRKVAWMHPMHIELDLKRWTQSGSPNIYAPFVYEKHSNKDHHKGKFDPYDKDTYTPYWIRPDGIEYDIRNFNSEQRDEKAWSYNKLKNKKLWELLVEKGFRMFYSEDQFFEILKRKHETTEGRYYYHNNEILNPSLKQIQELNDSYEVIVSPTAGYLTEELAYKIGFKGTIIFYDHTDHHLEIKKTILNLNPNQEELYTLGQRYKSNLIDVLRLGYHEPNAQKYVEYVTENCDIQFVKIDLIKDDLNKLFSLFKDKKTFFHFSNIFSYDISMLLNNIEDIFVNYEKIIKSGVTFNGEHPFRFSMSYHEYT